MSRQFTIAILLGSIILKLHSQSRIEIIRTDSSIIKTHFEYGSKWVDEFYNGKNLVKETSYHKDNVTIASEMFLDTTLAFASISGISKNYEENGSLNWIIDNDNRSIIYIDTLRYPNHLILEKMKLKADSMVQSHFGPTFFKKYVRWNIGRSSYFDQGYLAEPSFAMEWLRPKKNGVYGATEFNIRYDIILEDQIVKEGIQIIMDKNGVLLPYHEWNQHWTIYNKGLEEPDSISSLFKMITTEAQNIVIKKMPSGQDTSKIFGYLTWIQYKDQQTTIFNGCWKIYILNPTYISKQSKEDNKEVSIQYYDVYIFNPWTGSLQEKKVMHRRTERTGWMTFSNDLIDN